MNLRLRMCVTSLLVTATSFFVSAATAQQPIARQPVPAAGQQPGQQIVPIVPAEAAVKQGMARAVQAPPWAQLSAQELKYVKTVLGVWETRTANIKRYECSVQRFQFDVTRHPTAHLTHGVGTLKFQDPGRAEFKIDKVETIIRNEPLQYGVDERAPHGEHWICDGDWVHILDQNSKQATRIELPPQYRNREVYRSPLPFVFGVKAADMLARYWIRPIPQPKRPNEVWLEVVPKRADDAANYSRVQVILDRSDTLPKGLIVFMTNWTKEQQHREVYQFDGRKTNTVLDAIRENLFSKSFIPTKLSSDWKVTVEPYVSPEQRAAAQARMARGPGQPAQPPQVRR